MWSVLSSVLLGERVQAIGVLGGCAPFVPAELCGHRTCWLRFFANFEINSHSVAQAGLGLSVLLLSLLGAGIIGMAHRTWLL